MSGGLALRALLHSPRLLHRFREMQKYSNLAFLFLPILLTPLLNFLPDLTFR